jgi:mono/diheme cytochrome c family protein
MRASILTCFAALISGAMLWGQTSSSRPVPVANMSKLMVDLIYPVSNDMFYLFREPPKNDVEWNRVKMSALALAESANLLMAPERAYDDEGWMDDSKLLLDVGRKFYAAAEAKNAEAINDLTQELNDACVQCHMDYRRNYGRRPTGKAAAPKQ